MCIIYCNEAIKYNLFFSDYFFCCIIFLLYFTVFLFFDNLTLYIVHECCFIDFCPVIVNFFGCLICAPLCSRYLNKTLKNIKYVSFYGISICVLDILKARLAEVDVQNISLVHTHTT